MYFLLKMGIFHQRVLCLEFFTPLFHPWRKSFENPDRNRKTPGYLPKLGILGADDFSWRKKSLKYFGGHPNL